MVEHEEALSRLPEGHARALRLRDQGLGEAAIADTLSIPTSGVGPLLTIAEAKLARLLAEESAEPHPASR
jgi:DNA-directed RNA polymerase specialized sigma24 family protein